MILPTENRCIIIAEAGVNHNGDLTMAKELIHVAAEAGADYVKFQTFSADKLVTRSAKQAEYQKKNLQSTGKDESQYTMLKKLELSRDAHYELIRSCRYYGIEFLSTAFDNENLLFLTRELDLDYIKIPSGELTNYPYLRLAAGLGKPIILSTGMALLHNSIRSFSSKHFFARRPSTSCQRIGEIPVPGRLVVRFSSVKSSPFSILTAATMLFRATSRLPSSRMLAGFFSPKPIARWTLRMEMTIRFNSSGSSDAG